MLRSKNLNAHLSSTSNMLYKICTFDESMLSSFDTLDGQNMYVLSIPISYKSTAIVRIGCGHTRNIGITINRCKASIIDAPIALNTGFKICFKISEDKKKCEVYAYALTNIGIQAAVTLISQTSERPYPTISLDARLSPSITDESYFDKIETIYPQDLYISNDPIMMPDNTMWGGTEGQARTVVFSNIVPNNGYLYRFFSCDYILGYIIEFLYIVRGTESNEFIKYIIGEDRVDSVVYDRNLHTLTITLKSSVTNIHNFFRLEKLRIHTGPLYPLY